jgi:hypothetical protein
MADESHLSLLKQGVEAWNRSRKQDLSIEPDLRNANLRGADLSEANLKKANLRNAKLRDAKLRGANLDGAQLHRALLHRADLSLASLWSADLSEANLRSANLSQANLLWASLSQADLDKANLSGAGLRCADLSETNLKGANLWRADLGFAIFERVTIGFTNFGGVDLSTCNGLDLVEHSGPSTLGVDSIIRSKGQIPEAFLRGVGLPDEWIDYIPSLVGDGIQFFSCFISYSSLDKPFAVRLHDALQSKGIRCWLDEKQLLPGHDMSRELERGIYLWDKVLLCASKNSLTSDWCAHRREKGLILPI